MYREKTNELGALETEHPVSRRGSLLFRLSAFGLVILGVGLTAWMTQGFAPNHHPSFSSNAEQWAVSLSVGGLLVLLGGVLAVFWILRGGEVFRVYEGGLVRADRSAPKSPARAMRWDAIRSLRKKHTVTRMGIHTRYSVEDQDGRQWVIRPWITNAADIGQRVLQEILGRRQSIRDALARGESASFGLFTLTAKGVGVGPRSILFHEIDAVRVTFNSIGLWRSKEATPWIRAGSDSVANLDLLLELLGEYGVRVVS